MHLRSLVVCLGLALGLASAGPARGQSRAGRPEPAPADGTEKNLHAIRLAGAAPRIDGRLDDEAWHTAESIEDFVQMDPDNMVPATERTVAQVAYDDRYVYVAVHCYSRDPSQVTAGLGRRDNFPRSDRLSITFDPRHDHQTGYVYQVNPSGVQGDVNLYDDTSSSSDYDGVWEAGAQVIADGWSAEIRVPLSQMRFTVSPATGAVWGLNIERGIAATGETVRWVATPRGARGLVSRFGHLIFSNRLTPPRRVEILPFTLAGAQRSAAASNRTTLNGGADLRVGLGTSGTLSATINPDFGQVEADPAILNLSVFETYFPEKRPFFLEDSRIFVLPYSQAPDFYSRRIGQTPGRLELPSGDTLVRKPDHTTILGAAKLTGKANGLTFGGLAALTAREYATVDVTTDAGDGPATIIRAERLIEPATLYSVGRVQRDVLRASSNIGVIGTAVVREKDLDAFTGGPDYNIRWSRNRYTFKGHWLVTHAPVSGVVRTGFGGLTNFNYSGKYLGVSGHYDHFGADFRNSAIGYLATRPNKNEASGQINLGNPDPWKLFRNSNVGIYVTRQWNDDGLVFGNWAGVEANLNYRNYWNTNFGATHNFRRFDDLDTRGGPPIVRVAGDSLYFNLNTDSRKPWQLNPIGVSGGRDVSGAWNGRVNVTLRVQPSTRLQASVAASLTFAQDVAQWIENEDLDGDGTDEHIYGRLRRDVVNITGRATYAFSPDLTLEAYLQPFVAAGDYTDIRKLARPMSFDFDSVAIADNPDFNKKSLRGTIVMRWEYVRGSTLFVVWNMANLDDTSRPGVFSPWQDLGTGFTAPGTNVFVVKLTYWFTP